MKNNVSLQLLPLGGFHVECLRSSAQVQRWCSKS